ncbi:glycosyltransferase [Epilithonimonas ginsengisoli]|uniref:Glycosyltransferase n=1 Tax=Epilithonimonas ginsengisoli TaxID=1245592 RepID=A0ABU4JGP8_9FLAO|nr:MULTISPECIES: glycosyltransferase [Chryseobacterium group]MBV6880173.1 glycosyltransferase [Epilithonimonas sp. FP105]MDW8548799.1 glycosyltransferase [Epilithonimonas ginsengisoli]OAH76242.1 glycosyl transferase [Chryseobacterium sp. FP211-J200]
MKILHVITRSDLGGAQSVVINLANSMCSDHKITVVAGEDGPMWDALDDRVAKMKIEDIVRPISVLKDIRAFFKLRRLYSSIKPDVIHLHSSKIGVLGRLAFPKAKIVYSIHGFDSIRLAYRKFLPLEKLLKNCCKAIVVASDYDRKNAINEGVNKNLHVVYNGVETPHKEPQLSLPGVKSDKKTIICIARISPQKRFESYLDIAKLLPEYEFVWIGAQEQYPNLPPNVIVLEGMPNAKRFIQLADLFVLPTNYEGVPIVIIDALSYGKPVVSSNVGGISEIVLNNQNGYVIDNNDNLFAEKIRFILEDEAVYSSFSNKSSEIFFNRLTIKKMVSSYLEIYEI